MTQNKVFSALSSVWSQPPECFPGRQCKWVIFIRKPQNPFSLSKAILLIWVEAVMARTRSHNTTKNHHLFIWVVYHFCFSLLFLSSLISRQSSSSLFASTPRFSVFQAFRTPTSAASPAWKLLKLFHSCSSFGSLFQCQFLGRAFLDSPLEVILCFIFSTVLCSLLSRFCCSLYNLNFLHHFSPAPTPNPTHSRSTGSASNWHEAACMLISSRGLAKEHPGTWQAFFNLYTARSCWCFCSVHFCFLSGMEREI